MSDTWGLAKVVRKVEFKLLHLRTSPRVTSPSVLVAEQSLTFVPDSDWVTVVYPGMRN